MTRSELIQAISKALPMLSPEDVEQGVRRILDQLGDALAHGERIEIRGFGSFTLHIRPARQGRNPRSGETVAIPARSVPHFKPGKELRERVDGSAKI